MIGLLVLFVVAVAAHGLVIWSGPIERAAALAMTAVAVALIALVARGGLGRRRAIVELRRDRRRERTTFSITGAGQAILADAPVGGPGAVPATADVPAGRWQELRIWPHEVSRDGWSVPLSAELELESGGGTTRCAIAASADPVVVELDGRPTIARIRLEDGSHA